MKIRVVSSREEIAALMPNETHVHLAFLPSNKDIFKLLEKMPKSFCGLILNPIMGCSHRRCVTSLRCREFNLFKECMGCLS